MGSGDGYRDGFDKGYGDARSKTPSNPKPPLVKSVVSRDRYMDEYMAGYKEGYRNGCRDSK